MIQISNGVIIVFYVGIILFFVVFIINAKMTTLRNFVADHIEGRICKRIGCQSKFAGHFKWPHRIVCPIVVNFTLPIATKEMKERITRNER